MRAACRRSRPHNRADLAWATGFLHAQDRFFEMDLSRRLAAGELSELVGRVALEQDRKARLFRFRSVAREVVAQATPEQRALLEAYTRGVNAGLARLRARPWEYWLLGQPPGAVAHRGLRSWSATRCGGICRPTISGAQILRREVDARLGGPTCAGGWKCALQFLYPARTDWDAPDVSAPEPPASPAPVPAAGRARPAQCRAGAAGQGRAGRARR